MPTTYAHFKHGEAVIQRVKPEVRRIIEKYPELFHFGVHGPDLLFYYDALKKNSVNRTGNAIHSRPGIEFFEPAALVLKQVERERSSDLEPSLAYLYGFLCHYSLDVCCHGYIQEKINASGISHAELEAELDRELLVRDGKDPVSAKLTGHLVPSGRNARVISRFFVGISREEIFKAMKDMVKYLDLLVLPEKWKRNSVLFLLRVAKQYDSKHGLIINYEKNMACADSTEKLLQLFDAAVPLAASLIDAFPALDNEIFDYDFVSVNEKEHAIYPVRVEGEIIYPEVKGPDRERAGL